MPFSRKSGNLNFLDLSGPPQACNGTALPLPCRIHNLFVFYADRVVIKVSKVLTKERAVFVQQSHLNATGGLKVLLRQRHSNCYETVESDAI
jgi:hypothetical protein